MEIILNIYNQRMMYLLKKFSILLICLVFTSSCITVVFEPYLGDNHTVTTSESGKESLPSPSNKDQKKIETGAIKAPALKRHYCPVPKFSLQNKQFYQLVHTVPEKQAEKYSQDPRYNE